MVYPISKLIIPPIYKIWLRKVEGVENIPIDKACIIAINHSSYFDIFVIPSILFPKLKKRMHAFVNSLYWKNIITRFILNVWQCIPVYVKKEKNAKVKNKLAFERALKYIKKEETFIIFPEGTRSHDGNLKKAYTGIAKIALKSKVPVIPVGIIGANKILPVGKILPRFKRCEVKIGKPIFFQKYYNKKITHNLLEGVTRKIMNEIAKLINQKYNY